MTATTEDDGDGDGDGDSATATARRDTMTTKMATGDDGNDR